MAAAVKSPRTRANSNETVANTYIDLFAPYEASKVFDYIFDTMFKYIEHMTYKPTGTVIDQLFCERMTMAKLRAFVKAHSIHRDALINNEVMTWSPVLALELITKEFDKHLLPASLLKEYMKDADRIVKMINYGKCDGSKLCLADIVANECPELMCSTVDLRDEFKKHDVSEWIDVIREFGMKEHMYGYDTEFITSINNLHKLSNSWNTLKYTQFTNTKAKAQELVPEDSNELFEIFGGNYNLIINNKKLNAEAIEDNKDAEVLVVNKKLYDTYTPVQQRLVRSFLGQNMKELNSKIKEAVSIAYNKFATFKNSTSEEFNATMKRSMTGGFYTNTDSFTTLNNNLRKTIEKANFSSVLNGADFVIHQYIPMMKQAKKAGTFKNFNHSPFMNRSALCVIGGGSIMLNDNIDYEPVSDIDMVIPEAKDDFKLAPVTGGAIESVEPKVIEKVVVQTEYIERPQIKNEFTVPFINFTGGKKEESSAVLLVNKLNAIQDTFNEEFMKSYRKIIQFLGEVKEEELTHDKITIALFNSLDRIMIKNNKTATKLSGIKPEKTFNREYIALVQATKERLSVSAVFRKMSPFLDGLIKACETSYKECEKARSEFLLSDKDRYDAMNLNTIKNPFDITREEITSIYDNFARIAFIIQDRGNKQVSTDSERVLKQYMESRKDKNKLIDEYFDHANQQFDATAVKYPELKQAIKMRETINNELRKSYKWLNNNLDVILVQQRLKMMKNKVLSKEVLDRIIKNKIQFNPSNNAEDIQKYVAKLHKDGVKPKYFLSYFKLYKLAKKIISSYGVLDFIELLYKELGISGKDFNWGEFKHNFMNYIVSQMIGIDVFDVLPSGDYAFRSVGNDGAANPLVHIKFSKDNATEFEAIVASSGLKDKHTATVSDAAFGTINAEQATKKKTEKLLQILGQSHTQWVDLADDYAAAIPGGAAEKFGKKSYFGGVVCVARQEKNKCVLGYSLRNFGSLRAYLPEGYDMTDYTIKSLFLPVVQIFDKVMRQRGGATSEAFGNINMLMQGGDIEDEEEKIDAGAIFDIIEPTKENINDVRINPEATRFYMVMITILKHYCSVFPRSELRVNKLSTLRFITPLVKAEGFTDGNGKIVYQPETNDQILRESIKVGNEYFKHCGQKFEKSLELFISDLNSCLFFDPTGEDKDTFMKVKPEEISRMFNAVFENINNIKADELTTDYVDAYLNSASDKMVKVTEEQRFGLLKEIIRGDHKDEKADEYIAFCDTVLSPITICYQHYLNMLGKFVIDVCGLDASRADVPAELVRVFNREHFYKDDSYNKTSSSLLLAYPEIYAENMTPKQVLDFLTTRYKDAMQKIIDVAIKYPAINETNVKELKERLERQFVENVTAVADRMFGGFPVDGPFSVGIKSDMNHDKFIPTFELSKDVAKRFIHYCNDDTFGFNPDNYNLEEYTDLIRDNKVSLTRYVCCTLANYTPGYYIPQSIVVALKESRLFGSVISELQPFNTKLSIKNDGAKKPISDIVSNADIVLSIMFHIARSRVATETTSDVAMSENVITHLCSVIPFLISVLKQYKVVCKDYVYNLGDTRIPVKEEATELIDILTSYYNSINKQAKHIEFGESLAGFDKNGYFTSFVVKEDGDENDFKQWSQRFSRLGLTPSIHEWINKHVCSGLKHVEYDRFKSYNTEILSKINDSYFTNAFRDVVIPLMADIHYKNLASHVGSKIGGLVDNRRLAGGAFTGGAVVGADYKATTKNYIDYIGQFKTGAGENNENKKLEKNSGLSPIEFIINSGIPLKEMGNATDDNCKTGGNRDGTTWYNKFVSGAASVLNDDNYKALNEAKGQLPYLLCYQIPQTLLSYNKQYINDINIIINKFSSKINSMIPAQKEHYNKIRAIIVDVCEAINYTGYNGSAERNKNILDHTYDKFVISDFNNMAQVGMCIINVILAAYVIYNNCDLTLRGEPKDRCFNYNPGPAVDPATADNAKAANREAVEEFYQCWDAFQVFVNACFPDVTLDALSKVTTVTLDFWKIITQANLRVIGQYLFTTNDTHIWAFNNVAGDNVVGTSYSRTFKNVGAIHDNQKHIGTAVDEKQRVFNAILTTDSKLHGPEDNSLNAVFSRVARIIDGLKDSKDKTSLQALTSAVLLLEDSIYESEIDGDNYKNFLRYGLNLHNENLLALHTNVVGDDNNANTNAILRMNHNNKKITYNNGNEANTKGYLPGPSTMFNYKIGNGAKDRTITPAVIARLMQLGFAFGDIVNNYDRSSSWLNIDNQLKNNNQSIFKEGYQECKNNHYWLPIKHTNGNTTYKITFESLIEDSPATLFDPSTPSLIQYISQHGIIKSIYENIVGKNIYSVITKEYDLVADVITDVNNNREMTNRLGKNLFLNGKFLTTEVTGGHFNAYNTTDISGAKNIVQLLDFVKIGVKANSLEAKANDTDYLNNIRSCRYLQDFINNTTDAATAAATAATKRVFGIKGFNELLHDNEFDDDVAFVSGLLKSFFLGTVATKGSRDPREVAIATALGSAKWFGITMADADGNVPAYAAGGADSEIIAPVGTAAQQRTACSAALKNILVQSGNAAAAGTAATDNTRIAVVKFGILYYTYKWFMECQKRGVVKTIHDATSDIVGIAKSTTGGAELTKQAGTFADVVNNIIGKTDVNEQTQYIKTVKTDFINQFISFIAATDRRASTNNDTIEDNHGMAHNCTLNNVVKNGCAYCNPGLVPLKFQLNVDFIPGNNQQCYDVAMIQLNRRLSNYNIDRAQVNEKRYVPWVQSYDSLLDQQMAPPSNNTFVKMFKQNILTTIVFGSIITTGNDVFNFGYKRREVPTYTINTMRGTDITVRIPNIVVEVMETGKPTRKIEIPNYNLLVRANNGLKAYERALIEQSKWFANDATTTRREILRSPNVTNRIMLDKLYETVMLIDNYQDFTKLFDLTDNDHKSMLNNLLGLPTMVSYKSLLPKAWKNNVAGDGSLNLTLSNADAASQHGKMFTDQIDNLIHVFTPEDAHVCMTDPRHMLGYMYLIDIGGTPIGTSLEPRNYFNVNTTNVANLLKVKCNNTSYSINNESVYEGAQSVNNVIPVITSIPSYTYQNQIQTNSNKQQLSIWKFNDDAINIESSKEMALEIPFIHKFFASSLNNDYNFKSYNTGEFIDIHAICVSGQAANVVLNDYNGVTLKAYAGASPHTLHDVQNKVTDHTNNVTTDGSVYYRLYYNNVTNSADDTNPMAAPYITKPMNGLADDTAVRRTAKLNAEVNFLSLKPGMYSIDNVYYMLLNDRLVADDVTDKRKQFMSVTYDKPFGKELLKSIVNQGVLIYDALNPSINKENQPKTIRVMRELIAKNEFSIENLYNTLIYNTLPRSFKNLSNATYNKYKQVVDMTPTDDVKKMKIHKFAILNELVGKQEEDIKYIIGQQMIEPSQYNSKLTNMLCLEAMGHAQTISVANVNTHSITCHDHISCGYHNFLNMSQNEVKTIINNINAWRNSIDLEDTGKDNYYKYEIADLGISKQIIDRVFAWNKILANSDRDLVDPLRWESEDNANCVHIAQNEIGVVKDTPCRTDVNFKQLEGVFELLKRISTIAFITSTKRTSKRQSEIKASPVMTAIRNIATAIGNVFTSVATPLRKPQHKEQGTFHNKAAAMFGGFSLASGSGKDIVNEIYGDVKDTITEIYLNKLTGLENPTEAILGYYKTSLMTLTPAFDRHMFMEILYNADIYQRAIASIGQHIEDPANKKMIDGNDFKADFKNAHTLIKQSKWFGRNNAVTDLFKAPIDIKDARAAGNEIDSLNANYLYQPLYKKIHDIDTNNSFAYAMIGYLKNLEYYDNVNESSHAFYTNRPEIALFN